MKANKCSAMETFFTGFALFSRLRYHSLSARIDSAAPWALFYGIEDETAGLTSVDLNLRFLSPGRGKKVIAEGRQIRLGRTLGYADCKVTDINGNLLAPGTLTVMVLPGKAPVANPPFPDKFLQ